MTWTAPSDEIPSYQYGMSGFWYRWETNALLTDAAGLYVTSLTYGHASVMQDIANVWDGTLEYVTEVHHYDDSATTNVYFKYPGDNVVLSDLAHTNDKLYFNYPEPLQGIYVDVGSTPNNPAGATDITTIKYWDGDAWATVGTVTDETNGFINSGWITWAQKGAQPSQFNGAKYYSYWYEIIFGTANFSSSVGVSMQVMPYYDINEVGGVSKTSCAWKGRMSYSFDMFPSHLYISSLENPLFLNGESFAVMGAGDGRNNGIVAQRKFHNELMVWQKEKGLDGGCTTLFQGYSPETYGKLVLSSKVGTFSNKSVAVVDGVQTSAETANDITPAGEVVGVKTLAFWLSNYGVIASDGRAVSVISDQIQDLFDPTVSFRNIGTALSDDDCADDDTSDWATDGTSVAFSSDHYRLTGTAQTNRAFYVSDFTFEKGKSYKVSVDVANGTDTSEDIQLYFKSSAAATAMFSSTLATTASDYTSISYVFVADDSSSAGKAGVSTEGAHNGTYVKIQNFLVHEVTPGSIRRGYEEQHWMAHDSANNVLRIGLVVGESSTVPNVFPVLDLVDKTWSFDTYGQNLSCMTEVEAASGDIPILQYGGGTDDGGIYRVNTGTNDIDIANASTRIDGYVMVELSGQGKTFSLTDVALRMKAQAAGDCTITPYKNGIAETTLTLSMIAENPYEGIRSHHDRLSKITDTQGSLKFQHNTKSQSFYLLDWSVGAIGKEKR